MFWAYSGLFLVLVLLILNKKTLAELYPYNSVKVPSTKPIDNKDTPSIKIRHTSVFNYFNCILRTSEKKLFDYRKFFFPGFRKCPGFAAFTLTYSLILVTYAVCLALSLDFWARTGFTTISIEIPSFISAASL